MTKPQILASAQALFPKGANKTVRITGAWRGDSPVDVPAKNGADGWTSVHEFATYEVVKKLRDQGFTWVSLETGGTSWPMRDARIDQLIV